LGRQARSVERCERLVTRQLRAAQVAFDAASTTLVHLEFDEVVEVADERPAFALGALRDLLGMLRDGGQLERAQQDHERGQRRGGDSLHHAASCASSSASCSARLTAVASSVGTATLDDNGAISSLTASTVIGVPAVCSCASAAATSASTVLAA